MSIEAKLGAFSVDVEVHCVTPGGVYDDLNDLIESQSSYGLTVSEAYRLAGELVTAANAARERRITEAGQSTFVTDIAKHVADIEARTPGPFVVVPARKMTPEEKAEKAEREAKAVKR
jgi:hypothetical protein